MFRKHLADIIGYVGIGFIGGSISHGFYTGYRSVIMAIIGILLFILHEYLKENKTKKYGEIVLFGLLYSISIGMVSGGLQHFLDSPLRSLRIIPIGYLLSFIIYSAHMKTTNRLKTLNIAVLGAVVLGVLSFAAYKFIPTSWYSGIDSHHNEDNKNMIDNTNNMMGGMMMNHANVVSEEQFIRDMIPHHQEAVDTSKEIVARSQNPELVTLTTNIIDAQTKEIAMMQGWIKEWYPNSTGTANYKNMMPNLTIVSGTSLDMLYLQGMMMHHMGAIQMAEGVLKLNPRDEVKSFANAVIDAQSKEIETMQELMMVGMPKGMQRRGMMHH